MTGPSPEIILAPIEAILADLARAERIQVDDVISGGAGAFRWRCAVVWVARKLHDLPFEAIGEALGGRHRTTTRHMYESACALRKTDYLFVHLTTFLFSRAQKRRKLARPLAIEGECQ